MQLLDYENLVRSIVNKYRNRNDQEDLYQVGMIGLINAYKNYNNKGNTKFSTYAYYYILGEVTKYIRENKLIRVSKDVINLKKKIDKTKEIMSQKLGRNPTTMELSLFLEIDEETIEKVELQVKEIKSLDYQEEDENKDLYNYIEVTDKSTTPEIIDLKDELSKLSSDEKDLIINRYFEEMTQKETSDILGISQVQVSRKETKILKKLKVKLEA